MVVISAPSGCGKDTVIREVCKRMDNIGVSVSCTTREARPKDDGTWEQHGIDYFFLKRPEFEEMIRRNDFFEFAEDSKGDLYGTSRSYIEKLKNEGKDVIILNIDNYGAAQVKANDPLAVSIFILPPNAVELRRRLVARGSETPEKIRKRLVIGEEQMKTAYFYDYVVLNDKIKKAAEDVVHIIGAAQRRTMQHKALIDSVNASYAELKSAEKER